MNPQDIDALSVHFVYSNGWYLAVPLYVEDVRGSQNLPALLLEKGKNARSKQGWSPGTSRLERWVIHVGAFDTILDHGEHSGVKGPVHKGVDPIPAICAGLQRAALLVHLAANRTTHDLQIATTVGAHATELDESYDTLLLCDPVRIAYTEARKAAGC